MNISVFITSYNQRDYLLESIESVLAQTLPPTQVVVVDDASTDGSQDLIAGYHRRYPDLFTPIYHKHNTGVAQVRLDALNAVTGEYVTYVDGDDRYLPEKLERESAALTAHPGAQIAFSNNAYMSTDGKQYLRRWVDDEEVPQGNVFWQTFARMFPKRSLFRMELVEYAAWKAIGFHDTCLHIYEDYDMRIRLTKQLNVIYVDEVLTEIRTHSTGLSKSDLSVHFNALDYLYRKNRPLLDDSPDEIRAKALNLAGALIGQIGLRAAREAVDRLHPLEAVRLYRAGKRYLRTNTVS
jgi:glycosyltransferase involved in cell wall biosynthesis